MRTLLPIAAVLALLCASGAGATESDFQTPETKIVLVLQAAVRADDKDWFVAHLHFPVRYFGKTKRTIRSKAWFLRHYDTIIGPELKASILAQGPDDYLKNYQGLMVGDGGRNIWFADFGGGDGIKYEIITINNTD